MAKKQATPESEPMDAAQLRQLVEQRAYQKFVERGYCHGHDHEDWLAAEQEVKDSLVRRVKLQPPVQTILVPATKVAAKKTPTKKAKA